MTKEIYIGDPDEEKLIRDLENILDLTPCPFTESDCLHRQVWCETCEVALKIKEEA